MGKLACHCLNVQIHTKSELVPFDCTTINQVKHCGAFCDEFFGQELSEVLLNLEGIRVEHAGLLRTRVCSTWRVYQCVNCEEFTHATSNIVPDDSRVLVHSALVSDEAMIERMTFSEDYSPTYRIVLKSNLDNTTSPLSIELVTPEMRKELEAVQTQLNTFLVSEESAMEERIRCYQESEREKYVRLQSKARNDKNMMMSRLLSAVYKTVSDSLSDAMVESPVGSLLEQVQTVHLTSAVPRTQQSDSPHPLPTQDDDDPIDVLSPLRRLPVARSNSAVKRHTVSSSDAPAAVTKDFQMGSNVPFDDVFQFDPGFQEDTTLPFSESDEDVNDTDDSSMVDDGIHRSSHSSGSSHGPGAGFSTSVPIDVPTWMGTSFSQSHMPQFDDDDEEEVGGLPRDPAQMAASIQALARSVHGNSSEIFGELPKPPTRARIPSQRSGTQHP